MGASARAMAEEEVPANGGRGENQREQWRGGGASERGGYQREGGESIIEGREGGAPARAMVRQARSLQARRGVVRPGCYPSPLRVQPRCYPSPGSGAGPRARLMGRRSAHPSAHALGTVGGKNPRPEFFAGALRPTEGDTIGIATPFAAISVLPHAGPRACLLGRRCAIPERHFFTDNLLVRIHFTIVMIGCR